MTFLLRICVLSPITVLVLSLQQQEPDQLRRPDRKQSSDVSDITRLVL